MTHCQAFRFMVIGVAESLCWKFMILLFIFKSSLKNSKKPRWETAKVGKTTEHKTFTRKASTGELAKSYKLRVIKTIANELIFPRTKHFLAILSFISEFVRKKKTEAQKKAENVWESLLDLRSSVAWQQTDKVFFKNNKVRMRILRVLRTGFQLINSLSNQLCNQLGKTFGLYLLMRCCDETFNHWMNMQRHFGFGINSRLAGYFEVKS